MLPTGNSRRLEDCGTTPAMRSVGIKDEQAKVKFPDYWEETRPQIKKVMVVTCSQTTIQARTLLELLDRLML